MIENIIAGNERILWKGKPNKFMYIVGSPFIYIVALIWGGFDFFLFSGLISSISMTGEHVPLNMRIGGAVFFIIHLAPVWYAIFSPIYRALSCRNVEYMLTDKRIYLVSGLLGKDIVNVEFKEIRDLTVNVNPFENAFGVGTIGLTPDQIYNNVGRRRRISGHKLKHIQNPYEVFQKIKDISHNVTTDQMYPNAYRPEYNKGYTTEYKDDGFVD